MAGTRKEEKMVGDGTLSWNSYCDTLEWWLTNWATLCTILGEYADGAISAPNSVAAEKRLPAKVEAYWLKRNYRPEKM